MPEQQGTIPRWFWTGWALVAVVAAAIGFASWSAGSGSTTDTVAEQWINAVSNYGIEPVYPPQEDIYVGDVFAIIAGDAKRDILTEPLPTRALKLKHLDLTDSIENEYKHAYQFPATTEKPAEGLIWPQTAAQGSVFTKTDTPKNLPIALLPDFTITAKKKAIFDTGFIPDLLARFGLTASHDRTTTFKIEGILTYGVSALDGERALAGFCQDQVTKSICSDASLRLQLSNILGEAIYEKFMDPQTGIERPRYTVELGIIMRVYLIRRIETAIDASSEVHATANGGAAEAGSDPAGERAAQPSASVESQNGSQIRVTPQTFERPVAFGYRSVRYHVED